MKNLAPFIFLFCILCCSCLSTHKKPEEPLRPLVEIEKTERSFLVSYFYSGSRWAFIEGVEVQNSAGEVHTVTFSRSPVREVVGSKVFEYAVCSLAFPEKFEAFIGDGDIYARPKSRYELFSFKKIEIKDTTKPAAD